MDTDEVTTQRIEYTRTIVPRTMRSPYWKYFGFPSDNSNNILTKEKIICTLCNTAIAYNKNTSNLRTHLVARHPDMLTEIQAQKKRSQSELVICSPNGDKLSDDQSSRAKHSKTLYVLNSSNMQQGCVPLTTFISSSDRNKTHTLVTEDDHDDVDDDDDDDNDGGGGNEGNEIAEAKNQESSEDFDDFGNSLNADEQGYTFEDIAESPIKASSTSESVAVPIEDMITEMLIADLLPLSIIDGTGLQRLIWGCAGGTQTIQKATIQKNLLNMYNKEFKKIEDHLKSVSQNMPFAISLESYCNVERKTIICIYLNYVSLANELVCVLYQTIDIDDISDFSEIFKKINLKNCSAAIVNGDIQVAEAFLNINDIPIVTCFESVISRIMGTIFDLPAVNAAYKKVSKLIDKCIADETIKLPQSVPEVYEENPWSKYNFLQFVQDNIQLKDHSDAAIEMTKELINFLTPFKITLDTISEEPIPLSSLVRPLTVKLLEEHFSPYISQSDVLSEVRNILNDELTISVLSSSFLNETTFFDPRFQHGFVDTDVNASGIRKSISERFKFLLDEADAEEQPIKTETAGANRRTSLQFFFNRSNEQSSVVSAMPRKYSLDSEIAKYRSEPIVDLEQCPISWWEMNAFNYRRLKKISQFYMTVPCCVNRIFKYSTDERRDVTNKRFMMTKKMAKQLWFLNYNRDIIEKLKNYSHTNVYSA